MPITKRCGLARGETTTRELEQVVIKQARCLACGSRGTATRLVTATKWSFRCSGKTSNGDGTTSPCTSTDFWR